MSFQAPGVAADHYLDDPHLLHDAVENSLRMVLRLSIRGSRWCPDDGSPAVDHHEAHEVGSLVGVGSLH